MDHLPTAEFAYNNSKHSSTSQSPFFLNTGYHPVFIPDLLISTPIPAVTNRLTSLQEIQEKLTDTLKEAQEYYKKATGRHRRSIPTFHIGDKVWLSNKNLKVPWAKLGHH